MQIDPHHEAHYDTEYYDTRLKSVTEQDNGQWTIESADGWWLSRPEMKGACPKPGAELRYWGKGIGFPVRGLAIDGAVCFYESQNAYKARVAREQDAAQQARRDRYESTGKAELQARYDRLPAVFQQRLDRFRANNPMFGWEYESYEMFCCEQAVVIANAMPDARLVDTFSQLTWTEQKALVPAMDDGHSGNTFGAACVLAKLYLRQPSDVPRLHGALSPLVGSAAYGDIPSSEVTT